ncbi:MAG: T9SS C-terminal target domain-containing protein [Sphingobacteriia bacterium]|nr:T9SS C-terminal target domain-containing protein [Sphingobacteriia bacterium]
MNLRRSIYPLIALWMGAICCLTEARAQTLCLDFPSHNPPTLQSNQLFFGDSLNISYVIQYSTTCGTSTPFSGAISLNLLVLDSNATISYQGIMDSAVVTNWSPGDTIPTRVGSFPITNPSFRVGGGVVVIWPTSAISDSARSYSFPVTVDYHVNRNELLESVSFEVYPNPGNGVLNYRELSSNNKVEHVRLRDSQGRVLGVIPVSDEQQLELPEVSSGVYWIEPCWGSFYGKPVQYLKLP